MKRTLLCAFIDDQNMQLQKKNSDNRLGNHLPGTSSRLFGSETLADESPTKMKKLFIKN